MYIPDCHLDDVGIVMGKSSDFSVFDWNMLTQKIFMLIVFDLFKFFLCRILKNIEKPQ